jgi:hypothetical protein
MCVWVVVSSFRPPKKPVTPQTPLNLSIYDFDKNGFQKKQAGEASQDSV